MFSKLVKPVYYYYNSNKVNLRGTFLKVVSYDLSNIVT